MIRPSGWNTVCNKCLRTFGDTHDTEAEAAADDGLCAECGGDR